jgi:hypothetical protein
MTGGTYEVIDGVETVWHLLEQGKGLVLICHGSCHGAIDWFPHSTASPQCAGLPVECQITECLVREGWSVLAASSALRVGHRSWNFDVDGPRIVRALTTFRSRHDLSSAPLVGFGVSSGGAFVLQLPRLMRIQCIVSQICAMPARELVAAGADGQPAPYPPTLFICMQRDAEGPIRTCSHAQTCVTELERRGVAASLLVTRPLPITRTFLSERNPAVSAALSASVHDALQGAGLLDHESFLINDPRVHGEPWRAALAHMSRALPGLRPGEADSFVADSSSTAELLNVAYCQHEVTAEEMPSTIGWLATHSRVHVRVHAHAPERVPRQETMGSRLRKSLAQ